MHSGAMAATITPPRVSSSPPKKHSETSLKGCTFPPTEGIRPRIWGNAMFPIRGCPHPSPIRGRHHLPPSRTHPTCSSCGLAKTQFNGYTGATMRVVLDTSVLVSAMRSQRGASYRLIRSLPSPQFQPVLSISLYTEWQSVLTRPEHLPHGVSTEQMLSFLRYLASLAHPQDIYYLWRPFLRDPNDDMVLECAIASGSRYIITHNVRDFQRAQLLGPQPLTPADFLNHLEQSS